MKKNRWLLAATALLFSCSVEKPTAAPIFYEKVDAKLKQRALLLQKKLDAAQRTLTEDQRSIDRLREQLCNAELNAVESKIQIMENQWQANPQRMVVLHNDISHFFINDRETLSQIIRNGPDSLRAQSLLDRVLQLITQVSDSTYSSN
jgi:hypothetical protein